VTGYGPPARVVVTGMGLITPLGTGIERTWAGLMAARSTCERIDRFDPSDYHVQICCEVHDFDPRDWMDYREARRFDRIVQFAVATSRMAVVQAGLTITPEIAERVGVIYGTGIGGLGTIHLGYIDLLERGPSRVNPLTGAMMLPDMTSGQVSIELGAFGPNFNVVSACATGSHALGEAFEVIRRGDADIMIAGAAEAGITPFGLAAFHRSGAMSCCNDDPAHACKPFDARRDGFVVGEGAGAMVLERLDHALARGAVPIAEMVGYGASADAYHVSAPREDGSGAARAIRMAMAKAGLAPADLDYVNAHGTGTRLNDVSETLGIKAVLGERAYEIPVSSTKSMHGHLMGAAGAAEAVITVETLTRNRIPPTINYEVPDPECDLDYVPNVPREAPRPFRAALSNSFGFGGHNACLIFQRYGASDA
jgi:3-oxoacyl-[acyl-carrier-protein] synthase II